MRATLKYTCRLLALFGNLLYLLWCLGVWLIAFAITFAICQVLGGAILLMAAISSIFVLPFIIGPIAVLDAIGMYVFPGLTSSVNAAVSGLPWTYIVLIIYELNAIGMAIYLLVDDDLEVVELPSISEAIYDVGEAAAALSVRRVRSSAA